VSNELSNYCGANRQPRLDDPGSFGAPGIGIDAHLACFTPKRSLVRTQYRPQISHLVKALSGDSLWSSCRLRAESTGVEKPDRWALWIPHRSGPSGEESSETGPRRNRSPPNAQSNHPLSSGTINGQSLRIELVEPGNDLPNAVVIKWPQTPTVTSPASFDKVVADAMKVLSNAVVELAAIRVWKKL
jgi:hypothetical protein